jgi:para-nitrobenzyl esterase
VCDHLVAPGSAGLFRAAIIQSAPCQAQADLEFAQRQSVDYAIATGCRNPATTARCLRALPATRLERPPWYYFIGDSDALSGPVTGTAALPDNPMAAFAADQAARVPVLIGVNHDEFTLFAALRAARLDRGVKSGEYPHLLADIFGAADGAPVLAHYSPDRYGGDASLAYSAAATDGVFACAADRLADSLSRNAPVYAYEFDDPNAPAPKFLRDAPFPVGASHSLELRYLFSMGGAQPLDPAQQMLSDQMMSYWSHFVTNGAPKTTGLPDWPAQDGSPDHNSWMSLRPGGSQLISDFEAAHQCPFWATLKGKS